MSNNILLEVSPLVVQENQSEDWKRWIQKFRLYLKSEKLNEASDSRKIAKLLYLIGEQGLELFNSFGLNDDDENLKYDDVIEKFSDYFTPRKNVTMLRYQFFTRIQQNSEKTENFISDLKLKSLSCEFKDLKDELVRDMIIIGMNDMKLKEKLLLKDNLTLDEVIKICRSNDITKKHMENISNSNLNSNVLVCNKQEQENVIHQVRHFNKNKKTEKKCFKCGNPYHRDHKCNIKSVKSTTKCYRCNKLGHIARYCDYDDNNIRVVNIENDSNLSSDYDPTNLQINTIEYIDSVSSSWYQDVIIRDYKVKMKLDTGADVNILPITVYEDLNLNKKYIRYSKINLSNVSSDKIPVRGVTNIKCFVNGKSHIIEFVLVDIKCIPLIGIQSCVSLGLVERKVNQVSQTFCKFNINEFNQVFEGIGCIGQPFDIKLKKDAEPHIDATRKIALSLHSSLKEELSRMVDLKIIAPITEPTEWVNSIVVTHKKDNKLRICLDPRQLNKYILKPHFQMPTMDDIISRLSGAKYFTVLDCSSGFWQIPLSEASSKLCTFSTPFGRFRYLRLPFGLSCSSEAFQARISCLYENVEGVEPYVDDFIIWGRDEQEHDCRLKKVLEIARENNVTFNKNKCQIKVQSIKYLGHILDSKGIHIDPEKLDAILKIPPPVNKKELERFMGCVTYLSKFIANYSQKSYVLRELLKKDSQWIWDETHTKCFNDLKQTITCAPVLTYFDNYKEIVLSVDSSSEGCGAVLLQDDKPIAFASKALTNCQRNYAQIEKEMFAILFGCVKFHKYLYGRNVLVQTDHKPLEILFKKTLNQIPIRIQRMMLRVQMYNLNVTYVPGKYLYIADMLSRAPLLNKDHDEIINLDSDIICSINAILKNIPFTDKRLTDVRNNTNTDVTLQRIIHYVKNKWPTDKSQVDNTVLPYWTYREELHVMEDLLFKGEAVIIPMSMRSYVLSKIHEGHMGAEMTINRIKHCVFWPNITSQIREMCERCETCNIYKRNNIKEPLLQHDIPNIPWYKCATDIFEYNKQFYLILIDYYSKYIEVSFLGKSTLSSQVIKHLKEIFSRQGIPHYLVSDNGPCYNSKIFEQFSEDYGFIHITSSPLYAQSNGLAESAVKIVKSIITKCDHDKSDPFIGLLNQRNTPKTYAPSPAQLLFGRNLNSNIPHHPKYLKPKIYKYDNRFSLYQEKQKNHYDKSSRTSPEFKPGDNVYFKKDLTDKHWQFGKIDSKRDEPRSYNIECDDKIYRRNQMFLKSRKFVNSNYKVRNSLNNNNEHDNITDSERRIICKKKYDNIENDNEIIDEQCPIENDIPIKNQISTENQNTRSGRVVRKPVKFGYDEFDE